MLFSPVFNLLSIVVLSLFDAMRIFTLFICGVAESIYEIVSVPIYGCWNLVYGVMGDVQNAIYWIFNH
jgi:hypothetical protein